MEVSNLQFVVYGTIGVILGLLTTTFLMSDDDIPERIMILIIVMFLWFPAIVMAIAAGFFWGLIKGADFLKELVIPYFEKQT